MRRRTPAAVCCTFLAAALPSFPATAQDYRVERIASGLNQPTYVTQAPGDPANVLYFTERTTNTQPGFNAVNPMQLTFVTGFRVENRTSRPLWITPVGTLHAGGKHVLPQFAAGFPAIPAFRTKNLRIEPGGSTWISYDWDDINFSEVVVRNAEGEYRQLVVDPDPPKHSYYR
jgi:hypothetical protein